MIKETYYQDGIPVTVVTMDESDLSSDADKAERLAVCMSCEKYELDACKACGCIVHTLMTYKTSKCPLNKW